MKSKKEIYANLAESLRGIAQGRTPWESTLTSLIALIKENLSCVSWVGFYRAHGKTLWVGPYQGKLACLEIPEGKGVCGKSFAENSVQIVPDVEEFAGHIACDPLSRSEIVLPVHYKGQTLGVLDLDSHSPNAFDDEDARGLQTLLSILESMS